MSVGPADANAVAIELIPRPTTRPTLAQQHVAQQHHVLNASSKRSAASRHLLWQNLALQKTEREQQLFLDAWGAPPTLHSTSTSTNHSHHSRETVPPLLSKELLIVDQHRGVIRLAQAGDVGAQFRGCQHHLRTSADRPIGVGHTARCRRRVMSGNCGRCVLWAVA